MKKSILMAALAAVTVFASCSKESGSIEEGNGDATRITLTIKGNNGLGLTRATSDELEANDDFTLDERDGDSQINDLLIFTFRADGQMDAATVSLTSDQLYDKTGDEWVFKTEPISYKATEKAASVYVVANTGARATGPFANVNSLSDLKKAYGQLDASQSHCSWKNVWMSGSGSLADSGETNDKDEKIFKAEVQLYFIPAKIYVVVDNQISNYGTNTLLEGVAIVNAGGYTRFIDTAESGDRNYFPTRPASGATPFTPYYYNGVAWKYGLNNSNYADYPAYDKGEGLVDDFITKENLLKGDLNTTATITDADGFYVFPLMNSDHSTWVTVYGKYNSEGLDGLPEDETEDQEAFWSMKFGGAESAVIKPGGKYIVLIRLKGEDGSGSGNTTDPTDELVTAEMEIEIIEPEWDFISIIEKEIS